MIFIPVFSHLGFSESQSISTSFAIQCFGMTAGALSWSWYYANHHKHNHQWQYFTPLVLLASLCSVSGLWSSYLLALPSPTSLHQSFSVFSIVLGVAIIYSSLKKASANTITLNWLDYLSIIAISFFWRHNHHLVIGGRG
ncbi:protein of unknown function DUF81 [Shewanella sp. HN-41]|nr:protein of unknown function DUF81 [Shewanella sp. HN-41]